MERLKLYFDPPIQGSFELGELNFLFVFQVNCPGCFFYGIPVFNTLYMQFKNDISFLGLSTAFEDFEYNNEENTRSLLENQKIVGETKKALASQGYEQYPQRIGFPVAMDSIALDDFEIEKEAKELCLMNPNYKIWPEYDRQLMYEKVLNYLKTRKKISKMFTLNQLRGTPSFVIFDDQYRIKHEWFGHRDPKEIKELLVQSLESVG